MLYCCNNFWNRKCLEKGGGVYQKFPSKILCLTVPTKSSVGESFIVALLSGIEKFGGEGGGWEYQVFPLKIFCLTVPKFSVGESFSVALIFGEERGGGGVSKVYVEMFLSHSAENFRRRMLYCCINFGNRKSLEKGGGEYQKFPSKIFCLTVPKISVGESFTVALIFGSENVWRKGREYQKFPSKILCLTVPTKISVGESFIVALLSGIEKVWRRGGEVSRFSVNNFLSHSADENFRTRILYCCINFGYRRSLEERGGRYQDFPSTIFCLTVPTKFSVGESFIVALVLVIEKVWRRGGGGGGEGVSRFSVEKFLSHSAENFRKGILYRCINFFGGGSIKIFRRKFFVSQ